jgi:penicillin-binding protein 2
MAYAPAEDPKIALAMVVENAGFGGANSAPIARRVFDYYLQGLYPSEEDMAAVQKGQAQAPIGKPRNAVDVAWPPGGMAAAGAAGATQAAVGAAPAASAAVVTAKAAKPAASAAVVAARAATPAASAAARAPRPGASAATASRTAGSAPQLRADAR